MNTVGAAHVSGLFSMCIIDIAFIWSIVYGAGGSYVPSQYIGTNIHIPKIENINIIIAHNLSILKYKNASRETFSIISTS